MSSLSRQRNNTVKIWERYSPDYVVVCKGATDYAIRPQALKQGRNEGLFELFYGFGVRGYQIFCSSSRRWEFEILNKLMLDLRLSSS